MKTEDLISRLAAEPAPPALRPVAMGGMILGATAAAALLFLAVAGVRPDLAQAMARSAVPLKTLLPLGVALLALGPALHLMRPEARAELRLWPLVVPLALAVTLWLASFAGQPAAARFADVSVLSVAECVGFILLIAALPAVLALRLLRQGASTRPRLSGALAGMATGAAAAAGYSFFCVQDNPLFFLTWYGVAIALVTGGAAVAATRILRW